MNLVLDFGNTRIKAGLFDGERLKESLVFGTAQELMQSPLVNEHITHCIVASVTSGHLPAMDFLNGRFKTMIFSAATATPLTNRYKSTATLGSDRLAASVGSFSMYPSANVLTVDAGTCIKYNFVNAANEYLGGAISPGIGMRLKAMHHFTDRLPLVEPDPAFGELTGTDTAGSLLSGAQIGAACEIDAMTQRYLELYPDLLLVVTGGDSHYLCGQLKSRFFAHQNLLLTGLNTILKFNLEKKNT